MIAVGADVHQDKCTARERQLIVKLVRRLCDISREVRDAWWNELNQTYLAAGRLTPTERMVYLALGSVPAHSDLGERRHSKLRPRPYPVLGCGGQPRNGTGAPRHRMPASSASAGREAEADSGCASERSERIGHEGSRSSWEGGTNFRPTL